MKKFLLTFVTLIAFSIGSFAQDYLNKFKDPLGYSIEIENDSLAYIFYDNLYNPDRYGYGGQREAIVIDSFYYKISFFGEKPFSEMRLHKLLHGLSFERALSNVYFYNKEEGSFIYSETIQRRNQKHWPMWDNINTRLSATRIGKTVHLVAETEISQGGEGWSGPLIWFGIIGAFFALYLWVKISEFNSNWGVSGANPLLFFTVCFILMPIFGKLVESGDMQGVFLYTMILISVLTINFLINLAYKRFVEMPAKRKEELEASMKDKNIGGEV